MNMYKASEVSQEALVVARALRVHRHQLANAFADALLTTGKWRLTMDVQRSNWDHFIESEFYVFVDYLAEYFERGDTTFKNLFVGEKLKSLYDPDLSDADRRVMMLTANDLEFNYIESILHPAISAEAWKLFATEMSGIYAQISPLNTIPQRILLVGDCLFLDILPFVVGDLLSAGISVIPDYATAKNPHELRNQLRNFSKKKFDLVFYSPFTYDLCPEYTQLADWRNAAIPHVRLQKSVQNVQAETSTTLNLIADLFDCPIHVHNSSHIIRDENSAKRYIKLLISARARELSRAQVNDFLLSTISALNAKSYKHLHLLDEANVVKTHGEMRAGAYLYRTALQHPATMGQILAQTYIDIIFVNAYLSKKKLIVCDLDNTLWKGVIGEGAVEHFHDRQLLLKGLKSKGVVLAINSKNDPANVHWNGGTLTANDFVCASISWDPKVQGMKRIQADLNLKMKDYVFIDDREDELELMRSTFPEVLCMDATNASTWRRFVIWQSLLEDDVEMDRTEMYQQREQRKSFVVEDKTSDEEKAALFASLQLKLTISYAANSDLKRVSELINRTNQFNLEGSRVSYREVCQWHASGEYWIVIGQTADRFGDMGTTCVAVVRKIGHDMEILPFVLSCRVFGYGIETAIMNHLKALAKDQGLLRIVGRYTSTPQNTPCKEFLATNEFKLIDGLWEFKVTEAKPSNLDWLDIVVKA